MAAKPEQIELHARRLKEALENVPALRAVPDRAYDPTFERWRNRVKQSLALIFGATDDYAKQFNRLSFLLPGIRMDRTWTRDDEREYVGDLSIAEHLLRDALEEVGFATEPKDPAPPVDLHGPHSPAPVVINVNNVLSQATNVSVSQLLTSAQFMSLPAEVQEKAAEHAKELDAEIRGQQRWPVLAKSLEALKVIGKGAYERVALPLLLDMLKRQAGLPPDPQ